jgi:hypothetical protein
MKHHLCLSWLLLATVALVGCDPKPQASETASVSLFKEGKGVWFSDETKKLFGLETMEVSEKPSESRLKKTAQIYHEAHGNAPANAVLSLSTDEFKTLKVGQPARVNAVSGDSEIIGKLVRLDLQTVAFGQVEGLIEFPDPERRFTMGSFVTATLANGEPKSVFIIPELALLTAADGEYVYAVNGTYLTRTQVKAGAVHDGFIEIEEGLYTGDSIATKGVENLWLVELSALKGGTPCCAVPKK